MDVTKFEMVPEEDGAALTAHPDQVLAPGETFVCSCGATKLTMGLFTVNGEARAMSSWCVECGDTCRWEPRAEGVD